MSHGKVRACVHLQARSLCLGTVFGRETTSEVGELVLGIAICDVEVFASRRADGAAEVWHCPWPGVDAACG